MVAMTGNTGGIGRAVARWLAEKGIGVVGFARTPGDTDYELDVTWPSSEVERVIYNAYQHHGAFDAWINLAGADILQQPIRSWSYEDRLKLLWETDVEGTIRCSRAALPYLAPDGCVINVGWNEALQGHRGSAGELYATAKAAVIGYSLSLAKTLGNAPRVYVACPGWVTTRWAETLSNERQQQMAQYIPGTTWQTPNMAATLIGSLVVGRHAIETGTIRQINFPVPC
jgi:3-oxoacyl-[acyl-carrier protein] reductase